MHRFHFDVGNYLKMVALARREPDRARRHSLYRTFFLVVPALATLHAICFALDPVIHPKLRSTPVRAPVFGIGHARSGTTLLHRLMTGDEERFSYFLLYEMFFPSLIEKEVLRAILRFDARVLGGRVRRRIDGWDERKFRRSQGMHESGLFAAEEDGFVLALSCSSGFWTVLLPLMGKVDSYHVDRWPPRKRQRHMGFYKECVRRQLYLNGAHKTHLSKNPGFTGRVEALIEAFPDARFVVPVRNPYETIPSLLKLLQMSWRLRGRDEAMIGESLRVLAENSYHGYLHPLEVLERHPEVPRVVVDYRELVAAPAATVRSIYAGLGLEVSPAFAARLDRQRGRPHVSTHTYSLEEYGLEADEIRRRLDLLFDRFDWDRDDDASAEVGTDAGS